MKEALYYTALEDEVVKCNLCPHGCNIPEGKSGICKARQNSGGVLYSKTYGQLSSIAIDPIEKKPLYHFYPGSDILSIGSYGCNFFCLFCQNWRISQNEVDTQYYSPDDIVEAALLQRAIGIAYTYNEPLINYEYVLDTARLAKAEGLKNVLVTNGYINQEPLAELLPYIDGVNMDIKSGDNEFYSSICGGNIKPVLAAARAVAEAGVHLEVTTLLIPDENDDEDELCGLAEWVATNCGKETVAHISAYFPQYKFEAEPTSAEDLTRAWNIFREHLDYVYCGNMSLGAKYSNTFCSSCGNELIRRVGYNIEVAGLDVKSGLCGRCGSRTPVCL